MKLELKANMYGRTIDGYIVKILNVKDDWIETDTRFIIRTFPQDFVKASYDIIDILEKGDYVNGSRVVKINCNFEYVDDDADTGVNEVDNGLILENNSFIYFGSEITSIVTKEQFEQMSYNVGE